MKSHCAECNRDFKNSHALRIHKYRAHESTGPGPIVMTQKDFESLSVETIYMINRDLDNKIFRERYKELTNLDYPKIGVIETIRKVKDLAERIGGMDQLQNLTKELS